MTKGRLKIQFNVDADKINWQESWNKAYFVSETNKNGYYIIRQTDDYKVICEETNSVCQWRHDLSDLEKEV